MPSMLLRKRVFKPSTVPYESKNEAARWDTLGKQAFDATAERVGDWAYQTTKVPGAFQSYIGDPIGAGAASIANWASNAKRKIDQRV